MTRRSTISSANEKKSRRLGLQNTEEQGADNRAGDTAEAADDGCDEGLEADVAHGGEDVILHAVEDSGHAGQGARQQEDGCDGAVHADAEHPGGSGVAGDGAYIQTEFGLVNEINQEHEDDRRQHQADQIQHTEIGAGDLYGRNRELELEGAVLAGENQVCNLLEDGGQAHGADHQEHVGCARAADVPIDELLAEEADERAAADAQERRQHEGEADHVGKHDGEIGAEHGELTVGPVGEVQQAVDQGITGRQQRVDAADGDSRNKLLQEHNAFSPKSFNLKKGEEQVLPLTRESIFRSIISQQPLQRSSQAV